MVSGLYMQIDWAFQSRLDGHPINQARDLTASIHNSRFCTPCCVSRPLNTDRVMCRKFMLAFQLCDGFSRILAPKLERVA